jgi:alpha-glucosidase (family GH31 glycosyl hydrolase)
MWADIDYMDDYKIFTISPSRYGNLTKHVKDIRANKNMTFVPIMDAGVAVRENANYLAFEKGNEMDIFIKQAESDKPLTAGVWCGHAYFPDYFNEKTQSYWFQMFDHLNQELGLEFDGLWLDMNEATSFCNGYCIDSERPKDTLRNKAYYVPG